MSNSKSRHKKLNPFAFPPETNQRFNLLIIAALAFSFNVSWIFAGYFGVLTPPELIGAGPEIGTEQFYQIAFERTSDLFVQAFSAMVIPGGVIFVVIGLTQFFYRKHPAVLRRRKDLQPLSRDQDPEFYQAVHDLITLSNITPPPKIEFPKKSSTLNGQAFGLRNRYVLRLDGGLRVARTKAPEIFRGTVLHELAHIANGDIGRSYFAKELWRTVVYLIFIPSLLLIFGVFGQGLIEKLVGGLTTEEITRIFLLNLPTVLIAILQLVVTLALVYAIRASLLRVREVYADWRASVWDQQNSLAAAFTKVKEKTASRWKRIWRLHPTIKERLSLLENPRDLFKVSPELSFFAGFLLIFIVLGAIFFIFNFTTILYSSFSVTTNFIADMATKLNDSQATILFRMLLIVSQVFMVLTFFIGLVCPILVIIYLVTDTIGLQVQREIIEEMTDGQQKRKKYNHQLWRIAVWFGVGALAGLLLTPFSSLTGNFPDLIGRPGSGRLFLAIVAWAAGVVILIWLWLLYCGYTARHVLGTHTSAFPPNRARRWLNVPISGLLLMLFSPVIIAQVLLVDAVARITEINTAQPETLLLFRILYFLIGTAFIVYIGLFLVTWGSIEVRRLFVKRRCPTCKEETKQKFSVGAQCVHCGSELAKWLWVEGG